MFIAKQHPTYCSCMFWNASSVAGVFLPEYLFLQRAETVVCRQLVTGNPCKYENYMMRHRMKLYNAYVHLIYVKVVGRRMKSLKTENKSCKLPLFPPRR